MANRLSMGKSSNSFINHFVSFLGVFVGYIPQSVLLSEGFITPTRNDLTVLEICLTTLGKGC